jgi:hypothetical protein
MKNQLKQLEWLEKEKIKDSLELEREKLELIKQIKKIKKEEIIQPKLKKLTIWQRLIKVLMG